MVDLLEEWAYARVARPQLTVTRLAEDLLDFLLCKIGVKPSALTVGHVLEVESRKWSCGGINVITTRRGPIRACLELRP